MRGSQGGFCSISRCLCQSQVSRPDRVPEMLSVGLLSFQLCSCVGPMFGIEKSVARIYAEEGMEGREVVSGVMQRDGVLGVYGQTTKGRGII